MKNSKLVITALLMHLISGEYIFSQSGVDWQLVGNAGTNPLTNFVGTTDNSTLNFRTFNLQRMTILGNNGFVGMDAVAPVFNLTIGTQSPGSSGPFSDGGILAIGLQGSGTLVPAGLTDDRFFWYPYKAAIRAGRAQAGEWDDADNDRKALTLSHSRNTQITEKLQIFRS